jgi:hypothetical protein
MITQEVVSFTKNYFKSAKKIESMELASLLTLFSNPKEWNEVRAI